MNTAQDIQYHEVKYIIDKTYAQRQIVRQKILEFKASSHKRNIANLAHLKADIKRSYGLYRIYQKQMRAMYRDYLSNCHGFAIAERPIGQAARA